MAEIAQDSNIPPPKPVVMPHSRFRRFAVIAGLMFLLFLSGGSVYWRYLPTVMLTVDGKTRRVYPHRGTVADLLKERNIVLNADDLISPPLTTPLTHNMPVKLVRVKTTVEIVHTPMPPTIHWSTRTRQNLRRVLVQRGYAADKIQSVRLTQHDGKEVNRQITTEKVVRRPFFTLTLFNDDGFPAKKYDLTKAKTLKMMATGYYVGDPMVPGDETRLGYKLQRGLVAVDPRVIPLGTRLYIPGYGYSFAADTGSAILGMRIDLAVSGKKEEALYNHRNVTIYLLDKGRKW